MTNDIIWFATQVDRDFLDGSYGQGTRLYSDEFEEEYKLITGFSYDGSILKVRDSNGNIIELKNEPENKRFENTIKWDWKDWDTNHGANFEEDRCDFEPWAYDSLEALAVELGVYEINEENRPDFKMFYGK